MPFPPDVLAELAAAEEVEIETRRPDGPPHRAIIWIVVDGEDVFVRSWRGATARWYREATLNPRVTLFYRDRRIEARVEPATDPDAAARASAGYRRKYAGDPATPAMVRPEVLPTTLRLLPI
jgi:hypothetical protein